MLDKLTPWSIKYFPNSFCEVVYQGRHYASGHPKKNQCQFSWYCDGKHDVPYPGPTWKKTKELATWFYDNKDNIKDITDGALYYHADYIPDHRWAVSKKTQTPVSKEHSTMFETFVVANYSQR